MPQITAYVNKTDHGRWMRVERKADVVKWLLDRYEAGDIELPTIEKKPGKQVPRVPDSKILEDLPDNGGPVPVPKVIKTAEDAKKAVEPMAPHENFFKKPKKK